MNKTPQSPFHVATPETPYGQVFKPNPSPDTRKGWVKWVDNFPDLRVEEPPLKKRALSTVSIFIDLIMCKCNIHINTIKFIASFRT